MTLKKRLAVLMTCHNRKDLTVKCLNALFDNELPEDTIMDVYLVDDRSTDGTSQTIHSRFPHVYITLGTGNLFWNKGMHLAFSLASQQIYDFYLWLNDDTIIFKGCIINLISTWSECCKIFNHNRHIIVGSTCDTGNITIPTYGGRIRRKGIHPFKFDLVMPKDIIQSADTMNGNLVLIPHVVFKLVGNLEKKFAHSLGDLDYGLRAIKSNCNVIVSPYFQGICSRNTIFETWNDPSLSILQRFHKVFSKKGLPFFDWVLFCFRHGGKFWFVWAISPYLKIVICNRKNSIPLM